MRAVLQKIKDTPITIGFLKSRVPEGVRVVSYKRLKNRTRGEVFKSNKPIIVLIPKQGETTGHFIVLLPWSKGIEYFSSLGGSPQDELKKLNEPLSIMTNLLGKNWSYNRTALQSGKYNIQTCAAWCLARVKLRKLRLREFQSLFTRITLNSPDDVVALMTLLDFAEK